MDGLYRARKARFVPSGPDSSSIPNGNGDINRKRGRRKQCADEELREGCSLLPITARTKLCVFSRLGYWSHIARTNVLLSLLQCISLLKVASAL
jgi:hypothetical protein